MKVPQMTWWVLGATIFLGGAVCVVVTVPDLLVNAAGDRSALTAAERVKAVTDARQGVLLAIGGFIAVVTLLFTRAKHVLEEKKQALDQDSNWTNRYTEAIKQLGDEALSIRLGGIYALERIAQDSRRDRQTILDVLCAYMREKAPRGSENPTFRRTDLMAAVTVIGRITQLSLPTNAVDLHETDLGGASLNNANLSGADLRGADLSSAEFRDAHLSGAKLDGAILYNSDLARANLRGARLIASNLAQGNLFETDLSNSDLSHAILSDGNLFSANLTNADLSFSKLDNARFLSTTLTGATRMRMTEDGFAWVFVTKEYLESQSASNVETAQGLAPEEVEVSPIRTS